MAETKEAQVDLEASEFLSHQISHGHARRMGKIENYFAIIKRQELFKNFCIICQYSKPITDGLLYLSLQQLLGRYAILTGVVLGTDHSDLTKIFPENDYVIVKETVTFADIVIDLPQEVKDLYNGDIKDTKLIKALNQIDVPYNRESLTWRLAKLDDHTLVYMSNHCLSDGITGKNLFNELQSQFESNIHQDMEVDLKSLLFDYHTQYENLPKLPPPIDDLVDYTPPITYAPEFLYNSLTMKFFAKKHPEKSSPQQGHHYALVNIPPTQLSAVIATLKKKSKTNNVTITSLIHTLWRHAQYQTQLKHETWFGITDLSLPCDARRYVSKEDQLELKDQLKFGANTSGIHKFHSPLKSLTWSWINYEHNLLKYYFNNKRSLWNLGILTLDVIAKNSNLDKVIVDSFVGVNRQGTLISNIGLVKSQNINNSRDSLTSTPESSSPEILDADEKANCSNHFDIEDMVFTQNSGATIFSFSLAVASTDKSGLNVVITMCEGMTSNDRFDNMVQLFQDSLMNFESYLK